MKLTIIFAVCSVLALLSIAQADIGETVTIPEPLVSEVEIEPAPTLSPIDFEVRSAWTKRLEVRESPPMSGLPPVTGTINLTMRRVADPGLPDPPLPPTPRPITDPDILAAIEEFKRNYKGSEFMFVSGTVFDHSRTFLRIYPNGAVEEQVEAWSNVDFNHFGGFPTIRVTQTDGSFTDHSFMMALSNANTASMQRLFERMGEEYSPPEVPEMADVSVAGPLFMLVEGEVEGKGAKVLERLHALYRNEGARLEASHLARQQERERMRAEYLANPPVPEDVTINFWKRDHPAPAAVEKLQRDLER